MTSNIRTLLICLLMLALPVQGWAAAGMLYCGSQDRGGHAGSAGHGHGSHGGQHRHGEALPDHPHAHAEGHGHVHAADSAPDHAHQSHAHHPHDSSSATAAHDALALDAQAASGVPEGDASIAVSCTVCAACCGATAVTSPPILPTVMTVSRLKLADALALHFDFLTDGPRRPPRS